ncbi:MULTISPECIES: hypothetical protein [Streptomyces]|uniref:Uncharacterized protein n=1 Tax=Streptomyces lienomycini TaxID=284035 RepID=A0ABV9X371_9ACTN|nr:hypothetical protein [Streptomyces lienomycini]
MLSPDRIRDLLRELDDPAHLELPEHYDIPAARQRFARLAEALGRRFGPSVTVGGAQDASFYGYVSVPAPASGTDRTLWVLISNFGPFVTTRTGRDWGVADCEEGLDDAFVAWLDELCTELSCVYVPVTLLLEPYDGPSQLEDEEIPEEILAALAAESGDQDDDADEDEELPLAWWDRYFQFM